ncbi:hypothetical protein PR202_gb13634 [Eleusine coracana subsp. coracana]|uniref:Uncharacterized protein n=1 Tax=Eleusine coracana subsp. coracana TaxID=191504 RepID=A0AAV5ETI5_ELECO|nr:hypothetical protein PR202_gb13634 [Eleusine coracana subsp. coracana]
MQPGRRTVANNTPNLSESLVGKLVWPASKCFSIGSVTGFLDNDFIAVCRMSKVSKHCSFSISLGSSVASVFLRLKYLSSTILQIFLRWFFFKPVHCSRSNTFNSCHRADDAIRVGILSKR